MKALAAIVLLIVAKSLGQDSATQNSPIPGYGVDEIEWEVETAPGAGFVSVNGTIENVVAEITKINPNFRNDYGLDNGTLSEVIAASINHEKRQAIVREFSHECFGRWGPADRSSIREGIEYLYRVKGKPKNGPGPGNCGRVSCSNWAAIWWCNDAPVTKELVSFVSIGNGAWKVYENCQQYAGGTILRYDVAGQAFHPTDWNVIVRGDWC